ncbi:DNA cytosine methyltransferase [Algiphilus aromaticivorans]|uniref:DNA cytosine methyltransferase n=1 Tax=Algiphilus aromaticivorans TaxID=382454 RepID=UPI0005C14F0B|nr:DNA (cytosine-5-)-methyltransferase [Algiphilus aromaticivorans]
MSWATAVDLFAGAGGFTAGATQAGVRVLWAANHWQAAVQVHADNHPDTEHSCQDLHQADWSRVPAHDILLASPACQGHSRARGTDRPHHDATRSTAWAVVSCAEFHQPRVIVVENVPEFCRWQLYPVWRQALEALGYQVAPHIIDAADHGVPQHRRRVYIVCTRTRSPLMLSMAPRERVPAASFIRFDAGNWSPIDKPGRADATKARIQSGRQRFGERFVMPYYSSGSGRTGRALSRPIGTITTVDRWGVVDGDRTRMLTAGEYRDAMGFPSTYRLPAKHRDATQMLGNAVCPPVVTDLLTEIRSAA